MQPRPSLKDRILNNVKVDSNGCWIWQLRVSKSGYGQIWVKTSFQHGSNLGAHRESFKVFKGRIPDNHQVDHLCKVRNCVNPDHLEAVTAKENVNRSNAYFKKLKAKTHCPSGHEYSEENTYTRQTPWGGVNRNCKTCIRSRSKASYWARKGVAYAA